MTHGIDDCLDSEQIIRNNILEVLFHKSRWIRKDGKYCKNFLFDPTFQPHYSEYPNWTSKHTRQQNLRLSSR